MKKILIVDDVASVRKTIKLILEAEGYEINEASSREDAMAKIKSNKPDLILLDILMYGPSSSGEFVFKLGSTKEYKSIKIIYVTSVEKVDELPNGSNIVGVISKPFKNAELISKVKKALQK